MTEINEGQRYTCTKDVRFNGILWFEKGQQYLCTSVIHSHQGDLRYGFLNLNTREGFTFETMVMSTDIGRIAEALASLS